jgi:sec-independent protein translocase protein TatB
VLAEVGYSEISLIIIVLIIVVGPQDLPKMLRAFGNIIAKMRHMSQSFQTQFNDYLAQIESDELQKTMVDMRRLDPRESIKAVLDPLTALGSKNPKSLNNNDKKLSPKQKERSVAKKVKLHKSALASKTQAVEMRGNVLKVEDDGSPHAVESLEKVLTIAIAKDVQSVEKKSKKPSVVAKKNKMQGKVKPLD